MSYGKQTWVGVVQENGVIRWRPTLLTRLKRLMRRLRRS